jgi:drug/metabolite transporter (DMT)-like permease
MSDLLGYGGGLAAALFWAVSSSFFTLGGRKQSHQAVNSIRLLGATVMLAVTHLLLLGTIFPHGSLFVWLMLGLSGMVGLALGDGFLMWAHVTIGPRLSMLIMSMVPVVTTSVAWILMGETLRPLQLLAMVVTIAGVAWVILERGPKRSMFKVTWFGILLGIGGMLGQAIQLLIAKDAIAKIDSANPSLSATYMRILWGTGAIWLVSLQRGRLKKTLGAFKDAKFMKYTMIGTSVGPFMGVWASYVAIEFAPIGIASTLMALAPLFMIPISFFVFKEKPTARAIAGTALALIGVAGIFLL